MTVCLEDEASLELLARFPDFLPSLLREKICRHGSLGPRPRPVLEIHNINVAKEFRSDCTSVLSWWNLPPTSLPSTL